MSQPGLSYPVALALEFSFSNQPVKQSNPELTTNLMRGERKHLSTNSRNKVGGKNSVFIQHLASIGIAFYKPPWNIYLLLLKIFSEFQPCGHQCSRHGTCEATCNCTRGYVGEKCEVSLLACDLAKSEGKSCMNGGLCQNGSGNFEYQCFCPDGWTGVHCEKYVSNNVSQTICVLGFFSLILIFTNRQEGRIPIK